MHALIASLQFLTAISYQIALKIASVVSRFLRLYDYQESPPQKGPSRDLVFIGSHKPSFSQP
jgi:hypothetical protein